MSKERSLKTLPLNGGALPFHFINTVYAWRGKNLHEYLNSYEELLEWAGKVKLVPNKILAGLENHSKEFPGKTQSAFSKIKEVRFLLYRLFSGLAGTRVPPDILKAYNFVLKEALSHYGWANNKKTIRFVLDENAQDLMLPLYILLKQSHDLIKNEDSSRIKECPRCGWIFLDISKNNHRRWCNPSTCGSVEKASKYYQKIKKARLNIIPNNKKKV